MLVNQPVLKICVAKKWNGPVRIVTDTVDKIAGTVEFADIEELGPGFIKENLTGDRATKAA